MKIKRLFLLFFCISIVLGINTGCSEKIDVHDYIEIWIRNYTKYDYVYGYSVVRAEQPLIYGSAAGEGNPIYWHAADTKPVTLHVIWAVVYDKEKNNADTSYDPYKNPDSPPGTMWCEAFVPVQQPYPTDPAELILEFFPDGSVKAHIVGIVGAPAAEQARPKYDKFATPPKGKICLNEIKNPMYGLVRGPQWN